MKIAILLLALASVVLAVPHRHEVHRRVKEKASAPDMNIPALAEKLGATTLVDLVKKTGLAEALSGPGPFTVFGPVNEAFERLPAVIANNLTLVKEFLLYHVVSGDIYSSQLKNGQLAPSLLQQTEILINLYSREGHTVATAEGSRIILADQNATNGVIHVVSHVMYPPLGPIPAFLTSSFAVNFTTLLTAVEAAGLVEALSGPGPFTVFAPTNAAFAKIPPETLANLLKNKTQLTKVLTFHAVSGTEWAAGLYDKETVPTVEGQSLTIEISGGGQGHHREIDIGYGQGKSARVLVTDISATNGVIHAIDTVMLPSDL